VDGLRFDAQIGYLDTRISSGSSIDSINRTQGNPAFAEVRSIDSGSFAASCIVPVAVLADVQGGINAGAIPSEAMGTLCTGPFAFPGASGGIPVNLTGLELPNAPHWTLSVGGEYETAISADWDAALRADFYHQTSSFARIYNSQYDELSAYDNLNLSLRISSEALGLEFLGYVRNLLSEDTVTNIRVGGDETGGERTVFGKDRVSYGLSVTKRF